MTPTRLLAVFTALTALLVSPAARACGPTDWTCQAIWTCHAPGSFPGWASVGTCGQGDPICVAYNVGLPLAVYVSCSGNGTQATAETQTPPSLDAFLASLNAGTDGAAPTVTTVEHDEVLRVLEREAPPLTRRAPGAGDASER